MLLSFLETRTVGAGTEPPVPSTPHLAAVKVVFFALSVAEIEASNNWYSEKLSLAVKRRKKFGKTSVIVFSRDRLIVE
jgi:hypothetical protein